MSFVHWTRSVMIALSVLVCVEAAPISLFLTTALSAQSTEQQLSQRRLEYRAAGLEYQSAQSALSVVERRFDTAVREISRARRANDDPAHIRALVQAQDLTIPMSDGTRRVDDTRSAYEDARQALIDLLIVRQAQLIDAADAALSTIQRRTMDALLLDVSNELSALEIEAENSLRLAPIAGSDITFDPRDGPDEFEAKAEILERSAANVDTAIASTQEQIDNLEERLRRERQRRDFLSGTDRFGDRTNLAGTGLATRDPRVQASDSAVAGGLPLSLEDRVAQLNGIREQLVLRRERLLRRAQDFRAAIRRLSW